MKNNLFFYICLMAGLTILLPAYSFAQDAKPALNAIVHDGQITLTVSSTDATDALFTHSASGQIALDFYFQVDDRRNGVHTTQPNLQSRGDVYLIFPVNMKPDEPLDFTVTQYGPSGKIIHTYTFVEGKLSTPDNSTPDACPTSILCDDTGLWIVFDPATYNVTRAREMSFSLFFGDGNPYNGLYSWDKWQPINTDNNSIHVAGTFDCSQISTENVTIAFQGLVCQIENGQSNGDLSCSPFGDYYTPSDGCAEYFESCSTTLLALLQGNASEIGCRQWKEQDLENCGTNTYIYRAGSVSIGTSGRAPAMSAGNFATKAALTVKNGVITDKVNIKFCNTFWCDYVFEPGYALRSLPETEAYIQQNCHLPGMPAGDKLESEGAFDLGDVTRMQQEKIEEIYLHLIRLESEVDYAEALLGWLEWRDKWRTR